MPLPLVALAIASMLPIPDEPSYSQDTPEAAYKSFLVAMMTGDEAALKALTLHADGFEWLLKGTRLTGPRAASFRKNIEERTVLKRLKPGDEVTLLGGKVLKIRPEQVTDDRVVLLPQGAPIPTDVHRVEGAWKVDSRPMIASRRAADGARKRSAESKKQAGG